MKLVIRSFVALFWAAFPLLAQPLNEPELTVRQLSGGQLQIEWPVSAARFVLERTDALSGPNGWKAAGPLPVQGPTEFTATLTATGQSQFFRLREGEAAQLTVLSNT